MPSNGHSVPAGQGSQAILSRALFVLSGLLAAASQTLQARQVETSGRQLASNREAKERIRVEGALAKGGKL